MRGVGLVLGSIGLLAIAYLGDRWLWEISINLGIYGSSEGWQQIGVAVSLLVRIVLLVGLVAIFLTMRAARPGWAAWTVAGIGVLFGILPPLVFGIHLAMRPDGLPFVVLNDVTEPIWGGRGTFLPWTATGLLVISLARISAGRAGSLAVRTQPLGLAIGAGIAFVTAYAVDGLFRASLIALASDADAYPVYMLVGLGMRILVMVVFVVLLSSVVERPASRVGGAALVAVGLVGFIVLPLVGLLAQPFPLPGSSSLAAMLDPGTTGRWMAGAALAAGVVELVRAWRRPAADPDSKAPISPTPEPI